MSYALFSNTEASQYKNNLIMHESDCVKKRQKVPKKVTSFASEALTLEGFSINLLIEMVPGLLAEVTSCPKAGMDNENIGDKECLTEEVIKAL